MVTGASSGVGRATALLVSRHGYQIVAAVRREVDGQALAREAPGPVHAVIMDLRDQSSIEEAVRTAADIVGDAGLDGLVNSAGMLHFGPMEHFPRARWADQYDVNLFGTVALTRAMLPLIRRAGGRIINIGAVGGGVMLPFYGAIASSKIALEAVNDGLRRELSPWGIHVSIIEPGGIDTPANDKMRESVREHMAELEPLGRERYGRSMEAFSRWADQMHKHNLTPEQVARVVLRALLARCPRTRYRLGWDSFGVALLTWLLPDRLFDKVILWLARLPIRFGAWKNRGTPPRLTEPVCDNRPTE